MEESYIFEVKVSYFEQTESGKPKQDRKVLIVEDAVSATDAEAQCVQYLKDVQEMRDYAITGVNMKKNWEAVIKK